MTSEATPSWATTTLLRAAAIAVVAFGTGAAVGYAIAHEPLVQSQEAAGRPSPTVDPRSADARSEDPVDRVGAILAPLHQGSRLAGYDLAEIRPIDADGVLLVVCRSRRAVVRLRISLVAPGAPPPRVVAGRYAIDYELEGAGPADGDELANGLAAVLRANANVAAPPALQSAPKDSKEPR